MNHLQGSMQSIILPRNGTKQSDETARLKLAGKVIPAAKTSKKQNQFASVLAHEVRSPLTNIDLSIELLDAVITNSEQRVYLDIIKRSSFRINEMISNFLQHQQIYEVSAGKHDLVKILDETLEMARDRIRLKKVKLVKNYEAERCSIVIDRQKLMIALNNIIINAIEAMTEGVAVLRVETRMLEGRFSILICDNGCGISEEHLNEIFKPFYTHKPGGLGLGLATTYQILQSNKVDIKVQSEVGIGTYFILMFDKNSDCT